MNREQLKPLISDLYYCLLAISNDINRKYDDDWEDPRVAMASINCEKGLKLFEDIFEKIKYDPRKD